MSGEIEAAQQAITGGGWAGIFTGLGIAGTVAYKFLRKVKEDKVGDRDKEKHDTQTDAHIAHLTAEITRLTTELKEVAAEVKTLTREKSDLVAAAAKAQAEALIWQSKVVTLETDVAELREELTAAEIKLAIKDNGERRRYTDKPDDRDRRERE
jgi:predicted RNase H-like nuclease (RuvC/YqgF family)